jgi:hypothetical protein
LVISNASPRRAGVLSFLASVGVVRPIMSKAQSNEQRLAARMAALA